MSIGAISSTQPLNLLDPTASASGAVPSTLQALVGNFNSLGQSLQSGDLAGAQQAFAKLPQAMQSAAPAAGASAKGGGGSSSSGGSDASTTVTNQVTTPNGNGTVTIVTTYADG